MSRSIAAAVCVLGSFVLLSAFLLPTASAAFAASRTAEASDDKPTPNITPYGHLHVVGSAAPFEFFRGTFGGHLSCGLHKIVPADPSAVLDDSVFVVDAMHGGDAPSNDGGGDEPPPQPKLSEAFGLACEPLPNPEAVRGAYVIAGRGVCPFATKAQLAQEAGAAGLVIVNTEEGLLRPPMGNITAGASVNIPVVMVRNISGPALLHALRQAAKFDSYVIGSLEPSHAACHAVALDTEGLVPVEFAHGLALAGASGGESVPKVVGRGHESRTTDAQTDGGGYRASLMLSEGGFLSFRPSKLGGKLRPSVPAGDVEFNNAYFGGIVLPRIALPVAFASPPLACGPLDNAADLAGAVVVVDRGECPIVDKARAIQAAGGVGMIVVSLEASFDSQLVGVAQAFGDEKEPVVGIPVVMVSHASGGQWWANRDEFANALVSFRPSAMRASAWDELKAIRDAGPAYWPDNIMFRLPAIRKAIEGHHPSRPSGSRERMDFLQAILEKADFGGELQQVLATLDSDEGEEDLTDTVPKSGRSVALEKLLGTSVATFYASQRLPVKFLDIHDLGSVDCASSHGSVTFNVHDLQELSSFAIEKRVPTLLRQQACLERVLAYNAAALGIAFQRLNADLSRSKWALFASQFKRFGLQPNEVEDFFLPFAEFASIHQEFETVSSAFEDLSVQDWPEAIEEFEAEQAEEAKKGSDSSSKPAEAPETASEQTASED